jgi:hypothetical protein
MGRLPPVSRTWKKMGAWALALVVFGCGGVSIRPPAVREAASYPAKAAREGLTIAADPYVDKDKSKAVFGQDMVKKRILAVNLIFENSGPKKFFVYTNQISFRDEAGRSHPRLQVTEVAEAVESGGFAGSLGSSTLAFGVVGFASRASPAVAQQFLEISLAGSVLAPKTRAHGFVFFGLEKDRLTRGKILVPVHDTTEDKILVFEIPIG